jgi:hypothetical protein
VDTRLLARSRSHVQTSFCETFSLNRCWSCVSLMLVCWGKLGEGSIRNGLLGRCGRRTIEELVQGSCNHMHGDAVSCEFSAARFM